MADDNQALLAEGASLVWRRRSVLWWVFAVNLVLGATGTLPMARELNRSLRHTLAGEQLFKGFDLGMFYQLQRLPEVNPLRFKTSAYAFAALFAVFMLFLNGGILETYRRGRRRISVGDFFSASGDFFWRFVRLMLFSLVPFVLLREAYFEVEKASDYLGDRVSADQVGFVIWLAGVLLLVVIALFVRLWFDLAKVHTVASDDRRMLRCAWKGLAVPRWQLRELLWMYLRITLAAWLTLLVAFLIWTKIPPTAIWATFVLLELVMLAQLGARLWQMASATLWYQRHVEPAPILPDFAPPLPPQAPEPTPQLSLYPETELPPADA
jgi:hypothetical protein